MGERRAPPIYGTKIICSHMRELNYAETTECSSILFFDVIYENRRKILKCVGPYMSDNNKISVLHSGKENNSSFSIFQEQFSYFEFQGIEAEMEVEFKVSNTNRHENFLSQKIKVDKLGVPIKIKGRRLLTTMNKDNKTELIIKWADYYVSKFNINCIIIYDNGSKYTDYEEIYWYLNSRDVEFYVVD